MFLNIIPFFLLTCFIYCQIEETNYNKKTSETLSRSNFSFRRLNTSAHDSFMHYVTRLIRAKDNNKYKCIESCSNSSDFPDLCKTEDNWLVSSDNNWDYSVSTRVLFTLFYVFVLSYLFVGISIVSDRFMAGIEVITAQVKLLF